MVVLVQVRLPFVFLLVPSSTRSFSRSAAIKSQRTTFMLRYLLVMAFVLATLTVGVAHSAQPPARGLQVSCDPATDLYIWQDIYI